MLSRNFSVIAVAGLLLGAGAAQANTAFPTAAEEDSAFSVNAPLPVDTQAAALHDNDPTFPSAALEGGESTAADVRMATPRNLERSYAGGHGSVFPNAAME